MEEVEWTEALCLRLIGEFRKRPLLWDQKDSLFHKKNLKPKLWTEIGTVMNIAPAMCKRKMVILMSSFRREKAKYINSLKDNTDEYKSPWFGFHAMAFLLDKEGERKRKLMVTEFKEDEEYEEIEEDEQLITISEPDANDTIQWEMTPAKNTKIFVRDNLATIVSPKEEHLPSSQGNASLLDDEINYFSKFIASKMMKYSTRTKNAVQQEIWKIIGKADDNFYEKKPQENKKLKREHRKSSSVCDPQPSCSDVSLKYYCYSDSD